MFIHLLFFFIYFYKQKILKVDAQKEIYPNVISNRRQAFKPTLDKLQSSNITFNS